MNTKKSRLSLSSLNQAFNLFVSVSKYYFTFLKAAANCIYAVFNLFLIVSVAFAQVKTKPVVLSPIVSTVKKSFFVFKLIDNRTEKSTVAKIYPVKNSNQKLNFQTADFKGFNFEDIQKLILKSFPQNKNLTPIVVHLQECKITESLTSLDRVEGKVTLSLSFDLLQDEDLVHLSNYHLDTKYVRMQNQSVLYSKLLQDSFESAFNYLNNWINSEAEYNPILAKNVKVFFKVHHEKAEGDTIYYAVNRALTWNDFQEKPRNSKYAAMVFPSFGFDEHPQVINGEICVQLDMKVYLPKSACWVKSGYQDAYTLNHEQRHFDITAIIAKRFEQKIAALHLPVNNYDGPINVTFYDFFREMDHLQKQYDDETQHGINSVLQEQWNKRIDQELIELGIKSKTSI